MHAGSPPLLQVREVCKSFAAPVLVEVTLDVRAGEVHALLGSNGAGKSTLSRIISGLLVPDAGTMRLAGVPYAPARKQAAEKQGVQMVMQELSLVANLSVAENLYLNRLPRRCGWVRFGLLEASARRMLQMIGLPDLDPWASIHGLGVGRQQLVEVAKALTHPCRVLILDEPTAALTDPEIEVLFAQVARLKEEGVGILYITHRMEELRRIADRATVLRDGRVVGSRPMAELDNDEIFRLMIGQENRPAEDLCRPPPGPVALCVERMSRGQTIQDVSFAVHCGEIFGLAGLIGSGRTELLRAVFGADRAESGWITVGRGAPRPPFRHPQEAVRAGVGMIPEDRKRHGLLLTQAIRDNCTLNCLDQVARGGGWIDRRREDRLAAWRLETLHAVYDSLAQPVRQLSGGNQQKVLIARWLLRDCDVLLFDEPTRGIDVAAKKIIYQLLHELAGRGKALVVVSSDLEELMGLCDRIAVMSTGRMAGEFKRGHWSEEALTAAAFHGHLNPDWRGGWEP